MLSTGYAAEEWVPGTVSLHPMCPVMAKVISNMHHATGPRAGGGHFIPHTAMPNSKGFQQHDLCSELSAFRPTAANKIDGFDVWCLLHKHFCGLENTAAGVSPSAHWCNGAIQPHKVWCGAEEGKAVLFAYWLWTSFVWTCLPCDHEDQWKQPRNEPENPQSSYLCWHPGPPPQQSGHREQG